MMLATLAAVGAGVHAPWEQICPATQSAEFTHGPTTQIPPNHASQAAQCARPLRGELVQNPAFAPHTWPAPQSELTWHGLAHVPAKHTWPTQQSAEVRHGLAHICGKHR
jgi:hypothetical protein